MPTLGEFKFGYADADTELRRAPELFDTAYYDVNGLVDKLVNGYDFLVLGRKGTGKSALGAKIRRLATTNSRLIVDRTHLADFEYRTFTKISSATLNGGARFSAPWRMILLLQIFSTIAKSNIKLTNECKKLFNLLQDYGLLPGETLSAVVRQVSKKDFKITLPGDISLSIGCNENSTELCSPEEIADALFCELKEIDFQNSTVRIIIDGLDDALRGKARQLDIVSGLVRSTDALNTAFWDNQLPIKFIVLARSDVLALCNDPDLNKIKRDSGTLLNWYQDVQNPENSDLMCLVTLRFMTAGLPREEATKHWVKLFPRKIKDKDSWLYILSHTLNRPRDILQFLIECQKLYPHKEDLSYSEVNSALASYSENYFLEELKNEITGFFSDPIVTALPVVLSRIGQRNFTYNSWYAEVSKEPVMANEDPKKIIEILFENSYLGQIRQRGTREFVIFKHRDKHETINYNDKFIIHRGLFKALNLA